MAKAKKKDRVKVIDDLVDGLEGVLNDVFDPRNAYLTSLDLSGGGSDLADWINRFRIHIYGKDLADAFCEPHHGDIDVWDVRTQDTDVFLSAGYLLGQARAGVSMEEIKRQCRAMLERS